MSRVGKLPVEIPGGVQVSVEPTFVRVKGSKGELVTPYTSDVTIAVDEGKVTVTPANDHRRARAAWGTVRNNINNLVRGVTQGFTKRLEIVGVGFRAAADGNILTLALGYSHDIKYALPQGVDVKCEKPTNIVLSGIDKQLVGSVAAELCRLRRYDPYKGKGIFEEGARMRRKEGKKK